MRSDRLLTDEKPFFGFVTPTKIPCMFLSARGIFFVFTKLYLSILILSYRIKKIFNDYLTLVIYHKRYSSATEVLRHYCDDLKTDMNHGGNNLTVIRLEK